MLAVPSTLRRVEALQEGSVGDRPSGFGAIAGVRFTIRSRKEKGRTTVLIQSPSRRPVFQGALRQRHCSHCCTRATRSSKCSIELRLGSQVDFGRQSYFFRFGSLVFSMGEAEARTGPNATQAAG